MQLVIRDGIVLAYYNDNDTVSLAGFEGAIVSPYTGSLKDLDRVGSPPPPDVTIDPRPYKAPAQVDLVAYVAAARFQRETGGIVVGGAPVATDRDSQSMIANAYAYLQASGAASVAYKAPNGFIILTADQLKAIAVAVGAFVQACFTAEADLTSKIASGKVKTTDQIDAVLAAIPSNRYGISYVTRTQSLAGA